MIFLKKKAKIQQQFRKKPKTQQHIKWQIKNKTQQQNQRHEGKKTKIQQQI